MSDFLLKLKIQIQVVTIDKKILQKENIYFFAKFFF